MHPKYSETLQQITAWTQANDNIRGVILIGSLARVTQISDQWSDLDLMLLVDDPRALVEDNSWFNQFGEVVCFFEEVVPLHFTRWAWRVRRVLYADQRDVDFSILPYAYLDEVLAVNQGILMKGYRVIYDPSAGQLDAKVCNLLGKVAGTVVNSGEKAGLCPPTEPELDALVSDLLFHVIWAMKKIKRGELWVAVSCINSYMKDLLLRLIEAYNASFASFGQCEDVLGYSGRFLEQRTNPKILAQLAGCFTRYDAAEAVQTLQNLLDFIGSTSQAICERNGYAYNAARFERIQMMYQEMKVA